MSKLIVIVGITGQQGGSVAKTFLKDPDYKIRGITRDPTKAESKALIVQGIEIVKGDVEDIESLKAAFKGAHTIFGNTAFSNAFASPTEADIAKLRPNQTVREWCFESEVQQGKNIADAVAGVETLELFIWSTLSHASKWSKGKYTGVYHFDSKATVVDYINEKYPEVVNRMSCLQMGLFITNWKWGQGAVPWEKVRRRVPISGRVLTLQRPDGSMLLPIPGSGNIPTPFIVPSDAGEFVKALTKVAPGKNVLAFGDLMTWAEYVKLWSKITGVSAAFEHSTVDYLDKVAPGGYGIEIGEMYAYAQDFGYWGKDDSSVIFARDLGVDIKVTSIEQYMKEEDWSELLSRPVPS